LSIFTRSPLKNPALLSTSKHDFKLKGAYPAFNFHFFFRLLSDVAYQIKLFFFELVDFSNDVLWDLNLSFLFL